MPTLIKADGTEQPITEALFLPVMQRLVGGWIEMVTIGGTVDRREVLFVNEEGRLQGLPLNRKATELYRGTPPRHEGFIVGDAIRCVILDIGLETERYL